MTPQQERKLIEEVKILTGERGATGDRAVRLSDLTAANEAGASYRAMSGVLRSDLDLLTGRVTTEEGTSAVHTAQIAALSAAGSSGAAEITALAVRVTAEEAITSTHTAQIAALISSDTTHAAQIAALGVRMTAVEALVAAMAPISGTAASIPTAAVAGAGRRAYVTDSTLEFLGSNIGSTLVGGGAYPAPVISNGTQWIIG